MGNQALDVATLRGRTNLNVDAAALLSCLSRLLSAKARQNGASNKGKAMSDFLSEVQSDELAECVDYQEWIDLRRLEAIDALDKEMENCND
jgi:hypothetical protein